MTLGLKRHEGLGLAAILLLTLGTFAPAADTGGDVQITLYGGGHGDGIFLIGLAIIALAALFARRRLLVLIPATLIVALIVFSFFDMRARIPELGVGIAWLPLAIGAAGLLAAGLLPRKP